MQNRVKELREAKGWTQSDLGDAIGVGWQTISRIENARSRIVPKREKAIAEVFGIEIDDLYRDGPATVPIVGKAGAGPDGSVLFATGDGNFGEVEAPPDASPDAAALEVEGDSMYGIANDGWILFYEDKAAPSAEHMGELCVCWLEDERVLVKFPQPGSQPGLFHLESANAPMMRDVPVRAFAIVTDIKTRRAAQRFIRRNPEHHVEDVKIG